MYNEQTFSIGKSKGKFFIYWYNDLKQKHPQQKSM